jgi:hypothetical protein
MQDGLPSGVGRRHPQTRIMGFEKLWDVNPEPSGSRRPLGDSDAVPAFDVTSSRGVGQAQHPSGTYGFMVPDMGLDGERLAEAADGTPVVMGQTDTWDVWLDRGSLVDPAWKFTTLSIDTLTAKAELELQKTIWSTQREKYSKAKSVTVPSDMMGVVADGKLVTVPPGTYPLKRIMERTLVPTQRTPFSLLIQMDKTAVAIIPDMLGGIDDSHTSEAQEQGLDVPVTAQAIMQVFAAAPPVIGHYVPTTPWLRDDHLHYVTREQMGAVFVLSRMPASQTEVDAARKQHETTFLAGTDTPGVRIDGHIYVQLSARGTGAEYHEAIHLLSGTHLGVRDVLGWHFNEGLTEYLTVLVLAQPIKDGRVVRNEAQYSMQRQCVQKLVSRGIVRDAELAAAYFAGELGPLFAGVAKAAGREFSLQGYAARVDPKHGYDAMDHLDTTLDGRTARV